MNRKKFQYIGIIFESLKLLESQGKLAFHVHFALYLCR